MPKPGFWPEREHWPPFNFGHLWFLEHLLVYALLYAAVRAFIPADRASAARNPPTHDAITAYAVLLAATTFVIRIWYPQDRWIGFLGFIQMEPAHIAQYASLFVIGLLAGPRWWLETMRTRRGLAWLAVGVGLAAAAYLWAAVATIRGPDSSSWLMCAWEAFLCVGFCVGLPVLFRELAIGTGRVWRVLAANVFAVYVFHMTIVLLLQWALIGAPEPKWLRLIADGDRRDPRLLRLHQLGDPAPALCPTHLLSDRSHPSRPERSAASGGRQADRTGAAPRSARPVR